MGHRLLSLLGRAGRANRVGAHACCLSERLYPMSPMHHPCLTENHSNIAIYVTGYRSGFDISYKDIINSAEELALAGGSRTAASHLLGKLVQEQDPDLPFLTSTQGNLIMSFDDDDDYFERETYIDNVTLVDDRLLVGSDFSVARLHARKHTSSSQHKSGSGSTSTSKSKSLDRERKRRA